MKNDVIARLAAANPVVTNAPTRVADPWPVRRALLTAVIAVAVALPAVAFAGRLGSLLGFANDGTPVPTGSVLPGRTQLDNALQEMNVGSSMQSLGTLSGVAFYATRNADGDFCLAIDHVAETYDKGVLCDLNGDNFPSSDVKALSFPRALQGVAADGVATVAFADTNGEVLDSARVIHNLFVSDRVDTPLPQGDAAYLETFDANGGLLTKQVLPG